MGMEGGHEERGEEDASRCFAAAVSSELEYSFRSLDGRIVQVLFLRTLRCAWHLHRMRNFQDSVTVSPEEMKMRIGEFKVLGKLKLPKVCKIFNKEMELSDGVSVSWMCASRLVFFVTQGESEESPGTVYFGFCRFDQVNHLHLAVWIKFDVGRKSKHPL